MSEHPQTNGGRLLKRGDTFDPEDYRTTHRLHVADRILRHLGVTPTYVEHDPSCILHPDNLSRRLWSVNYHCDSGCPRQAGTDGEKPIWPEWATGELFDLAYSLADEYQTQHGGYNRSQAYAAKDRAERERQRADDEQRALDENDEQRDYAEERFNAALLEEE